MEFHFSNFLYGISSYNGSNNMIICQKTSPVSGLLNTMSINATPKQYDIWMAGTLLQDAMPEATVDQREFLISGCTPTEWKSLFGDPPRREEDIV